jgi:hypothetical protein
MTPPRSAVILWISSSVTVTTRIIFSSGPDNFCSLYGDYIDPFSQLSLTTALGLSVTTTRLLPNVALAS